MIGGFIKRYNHMFIKQIEMQVGILNGIFLNLASLQNYTKDQFYDWHCDSWDQPYIRETANDPSHGKIRKLSVTVTLYRYQKNIKAVN